MMKAFNFAEDVVSTEITVTDGFADGGIGIVTGTSFTTASLSTSQEKYYYNLQYNSKDHLSITYGHKAGSGSMNQSTTQEGETKAVYGQFYNLLETDRNALKNNTGFVINATGSADAYFVVAERLQMKDRLNPGTWTLTLSGSNSAGAAASINLTDNSKVSDATAAPFGERYSIQAGSAGVISDTKEYGLFYPDAGIMVLSATQLSSSLPGTPAYKVLGAQLPSTIQGSGLCPDHRVVAGADNAHKLVTAISKGSVTLRSEERQFIYDYFCRAKANEYNYSQNLTFWSGSQYDIRHTDMINNPQVYITEVGLFDEAGELMAIGRLSSALEKNFSSEAIVKVRLTY
tara:strand:- start:424 stop:1458 length:1035 start_codon:yes stop_codon:yes gene_type:complete